MHLFDAAGIDLGSSYTNIYWDICYDKAMPQSFKGVQTNPFELELSKKDQARRNAIGVELYDEVHRLRDQVSSVKVMQLIARGGEHLVFEVQKQCEQKGIRDVVVKINVERTIGSLVYNARKSGSEQDLHALLEQQKNRYEQDLKTLRLYFGEAIPRERVLLRDIPLSKKAVEAFFREEFEEVPLPEKTLAWISIQKRIPVHTSDAVQINWHYPEAETGDISSEMSDEAYTRAHNLLIGKPSNDISNTSLSQSEIKDILQLYPDLEPLYDQFSTQADLEPAIRKFAEQAISYIQDTGKMLDLIGSGNAFFTAEQGQWKLHLPDVVDSSSQNMIEVLKEVARKMTKKSKAEENQIRYARNGLNTIRFVNALARVSGSKKYVQLEEIQAVSAQEWLTFFRQLELVRKNSLR